MGRIVQIKKNGKVKKAEGAAVKTLQEYGALGIDAKVAAIQEMLPLALMHALDMIERDVRQLAGERYGRTGLPGHDRWRNSNQKQRWVAMALLNIEPRSNRVNGYRQSFNAQGCVTARGAASDGPGSRTGGSGCLRQSSRSRYRISTKNGLDTTTPWREKHSVTAGRVRSGLVRLFGHFPIRDWWNRKSRKFGPPKAPEAPASTRKLEKAA